MNPRQLTFAREFRGLNQTELANSIKGLSQSNLSKFEKGLDVLSDELKKKIIQTLNFPESFFEKKINNTIEHAHYRKKASITKSQVTTFENRCRLIGYLIDQMAESILWPEFSFKALNVEEGYSPTYVANYNRKVLNIQKDQPIRDIFTLIESNGIIIYELNANEKFDGISFFTDKGYPVIILNKSFSNDRKRFTLAHELGHILLHNENNYPISEHRDEKWKEKEANEFASEFLMPTEYIKNSLRNINFAEIGNLKRYWLTSMASIIRRAKDLGTINDERYKYFLIEMSRNGFNKKEPIDVYIDCPSCFKNGYNLFRNELFYDIDDFVNTMHIPQDVISEIFPPDNLTGLRIHKNVV